MLKAVDTAKNPVADAEKEIPIQPVSLDIWDKKYRLKTKQGDNVDADMDASFSRVARALADVETTEEKRAEWHEKFLWALRAVRFLPAASPPTPVLWSTNLPLLPLTAPFPA